MTSREFVERILAPVFAGQNPSLERAVDAIVGNLEQEWGIAEYDDLGGLERIRYRDYDYIPVSKKFRATEGDNVGLVFRFFTDWSTPHA